MKRAADKNNSPDLSQGQNTSTSAVAANPDAHAGISQDLPRIRCLWQRIQTQATISKATDSKWMVWMMFTGTAFPGKYPGTCCDTPRLDAPPALAHTILHHPSPP